MTELAVSGDKRMTTREVAKALGCDVHTVTNHANKLFPDKIRNGVKTYFDEKEVALILESIKQTKGDGARAVTLETRLQGIETNASRAVRLAILAEKRLELEKQFNAELQAEIDELKTENAEKAERLAEMKPKAEVLDKITATASDVSVRELAAILAVPHLGQNNLFQKLRDDGYIDSLNRPYRQYIEAGLMYEKEYYVPQLDATKRQLRITQKGAAHFVKKYGGAQI